MTKVYISPNANQVTGNDGIGRIVLAQYKHLKNYGIELVERWEDAEVIAAHVAQNGIPRVDVSHLHGLYYFDVPHTEYSTWNHRVNTDIAESVRCAYAVTVPSEWTSLTLKRDMRIVPYIIGHGIDLAEWRDIKKENRGYCLYNKGRDSTDVCNSQPAWELARRGYKVISTYAPERKIIPNTMSLTGALPHGEMKKYVAECEIYLATTIETFGIGTLEALACGKPVLGYDWGGTKDIIHHGENGYLVDPDDIQGLCDGVEYIRNHYEEMSQAALESAEDYDWSSIMPKYAQLYKEVAEYKRQEKHGVSVCITSFNYGRFVDQAVKSVLDQTYPVDEIIVVDDGSTDNTQDVLRQFVECPQVKIIAQKNTGVALARTNGIREATQPYIVCLDADDKIAPTFVQVLRDALDKDRGLGIAYSGLMLMRSDNRNVPVYDWPPEFDWNIQATPHVPPNSCIPSACMFRKEMWERAGGHKQVYAPGEDTEFWTRGLSVGFRAKRVTNEPLFWYRWHKDSASNTRKYIAIDTWLPWLHDKQFPFGAPVKEVNYVRSYAFPVVSVIIPVGPGHEKYVQGALDSLLGQTLRDWEVIVINDTGIMVSEWDLPQNLLSIYPFAKWVETEGKCGAGAARNAGVSYANAPLVTFLDADDHLLPNALELMVNKYAENEGLYVYPDWLAIDENKKIERVNSADYDVYAWFDKMLHPVTSLMATSDFFDVGGFDEDFIGWEDWDFFVKMAIKGKHGIRLPEPLLVYYTHTGMRAKDAYKNSDTISSELNQRYGSYFRGEKSMSPCCGGNAPSILAAKRARGLVAQEQEESTQRNVQITSAEAGGKVRMEFIGEQRGSLSYLKGKYRAGNNAMHKFIDVDPEDVTKLEMTGVFQRVKRAVDVPQPREVPQFSEEVYKEPAKPETPPDPVSLSVAEKKIEEKEETIVVEKKPTKPLMTIAQLTNAVKSASKNDLLFWYQEEQNLENPRKLAMKILEESINKMLG